MSLLGFLGHTNAITKCGYKNWSQVCSVNLPYFCQIHCRGDGFKAQWSWSLWWLKILLNLTLDETSIGDTNQWSYHRGVDTLRHHGTVSSQWPWSVDDSWGLLGIVPRPKEKAGYLSFLSSSGTRRWLACVVLKTWQQLCLYKVWSHDNLI